MTFCSRVVRPYTPRFTRQKGVSMLHAESASLLGHYDPSDVLSACSRANARENTGIELYIRKF
jgi:hypothetical protein